MRTAMQEDPVVESHYAGLDPELFHAERLPEKRQGYVSYRVRDKVYWSRRMVTLAAGETVLTDGRSIVRGRCGNLFSPVAHQPVAPPEAEPAEEAMDQPVKAAQLDLIPAAPVEVPVDTEKFENPKELAPTMTAGSLLPSSDTDGSMMPPVFGIGGTSSPGGGILGAIGGASSGGGGGGGGTTPSNPATEPAAPTPFHNVEIAPPLVLIALASQPTTFLPPTTPTIPPPSLDYPPTPEYPPITPYVPSTPPWEHPTPPGPPPSIYQPPPTNPPGTPPPAGPPGDHPKPPDTPPPSGPPPSGPPPYLPPPDGPPTTPPPSNPPPTQSIPEPSAWMMMALGIGAIAIGAIRRKS